MKTEKELESVVKEDLAHLQNILNRKYFLAPSVELVPALLDGKSTGYFDLFLHFDGKTSQLAFGTISEINATVKALIIFHERVICND